jgi:hypothetical protein
MERSNEPKVHRCYFAGRRRVDVRTCSKPEGEGDAQKVVTIISGDKTKTQNSEFSEQIQHAYENKDDKLADRKNS